MLKALNVLSVKHEQRTSQKTGKPFEFLALQGIMEFSDGTQEVFVYDWFAKRGEPLPELKPGRYLPVLEPVPNNMSRKLEARIVSLEPLDRKAA